MIASSAGLLPLIVGWVPCFLRFANVSWEKKRIETWANKNETKKKNNIYISEKLCVASKWSGWESYIKAVWSSPASISFSFEKLKQSTFGRSIREFYSCRNFFLCVRHFTQIVHRINELPFKIFVFVRAVPSTIIFIFFRKDQLTWRYGVTDF